MKYTLRQLFMFVLAFLVFVHIVRLEARVENLERHEVHMQSEVNSCQYKYEIERDQVRLLQSQTAELWGSIQNANARYQQLECIVMEQGNRNNTP